MRANQRRLIPSHYQGTALAGGSRRRFRHLRALTAIGVVVAVGTLLALSLETADLLAGSDWLKVRGVQVSGHRQLDLEEVQAWLGEVEGQPLLELEPDRLAAALETHPRIAAARVTRGLDRRLHVEIEERVPVALLLAGVLVEIDRTALVLPPLADQPLPDLPVVAGVTDLPLVPGERLDHQRLQRVLDWLERLARERPDWHQRLAEIDLGEDQTLELRLVGCDPTIIATLEKLTPEKLDGIDRIVADQTRRGRHPTEIDLRYAAQIIARGESEAAQPVRKEGGD
jgi:hypothetical protein